MDPLIKQILHLNCVDLSYEGRGFCRDLNDNVILVNYLFPGEEALVEVDYKRAGLYYGHIKKLEKESPERIKPLCPFSFRCGGCEFQSLSYKSQLAFKSKLVKDQLKKIAHLDVDAKETIGMDDPYYYRNKIQMPFALDKDGHVVYGFYKEGSHEVVPISNCVIEDKRANLIIGEIKTAMDELGVLPYDETTRKGYIRHAIVRTSYVYKEVMLILVSAKEGFPEQDALLQKIVSNCPELTSVYLNVNSSFGSKIMARRTFFYMASLTSKTHCAALISSSAHHLSIRPTRYDLHPLSKGHGRGFLEERRCCSRCLLRHRDHRFGGCEICEQSHRRRDKPRCRHGRFSKCEIQQD